MHTIYKIIFLQQIPLYGSHIFTELMGFPQISYEFGLPQLFAILPDLRHWSVFSQDTVKQYIDIFACRSMALEFFCSHVTCVAKLGVDLLSLTSEPFLETVIVSKAEDKLNGSNSMSLPPASSFSDSTMKQEPIHAFGAVVWVFFAIWVDALVGSMQKYSCHVHFFITMAVFGATA